MNNQGIFLNFLPVLKVERALRERPFVASDSSVVDHHFGPRTILCDVNAYSAVSFGLDCRMKQLNRISQYLNVRSGLQDFF